MPLPGPAREILDFWFGPLMQGAELTAARRDLWFGKNAKIDREIAARFKVFLGPARDGELAWGSEPRGRLALVVLLDQFPRNIYRGHSEAFAYDPAALQQAECALAAGDDQRVGLLERVFFYLPFEHAEELPLQERSVNLFRALAAEAPPGQVKAFASFLDYAIRHRDIIARFGRFPHRNQILGRTSTAEERAFLLQPGSSF